MVHERSLHNSLDVITVRKFRYMLTLKLINNHFVINEIVILKLISNKLFFKLSEKKVKMKY